MYSVYVHVVHMYIQRYNAKLDIPVLISNLQ